MEALVTKASSQAEKIKAAEAQVRRASVSMKEACEEQRAELQGFFGEHVFVIGSTYFLIRRTLTRISQYFGFRLTAYAPGLMLAVTAIRNEKHSK